MTKNKVITIPINILSTKPVLIIISRETFSVPNTIVFGGVATGSIKAIEQLIAIGKMSDKGSTPKALVRGIAIGINIFAIATLEESSVAKIVA